MPQLTPLQKRIFLTLTLLLAASRLLAVARSHWDWDEALFSLAVTHYDVPFHHPHPPGYPLFIAAAKVVHLAVSEPFRSVQTVVVLAACLLFPALFLLARELGFGFRTSALAGVLFAVFPNVWIYGGTAFSDVPGCVAGLFACALLLRGRREPRAFLLGAIVLGIAAGIRPMNLLAGFVPALMATYAQLRARRYGLVLGAMAAGAAVVAASYLGAALASEGGIRAYLEAVRHQSHYVRTIDSWRNPHRPPLTELWKLFFFKPVEQKYLMLMLSLLGVLSVVTALVRRERAVLLTMALFVPLAIVAWLNLDFATASRYAIAYMPLHALLAADALGVIGRRGVVQGILGAGVAGLFIFWTWPALTTQRTTPAPPIAAMEWALAHTSPSTSLYVFEGLGPQGDLMLRSRRKTYFKQRAEISTLGGDGWVIDLVPAEGAVNFIRPRNSLWNIVRQRNFEASVTPLSSMVRFGEGWYGEEGSENPYRWMGREATLAFPRVANRGVLRLDLYVPIDSLKTPPEITVTFNGKLLERFVATRADVERSWIVPSHASANEVRITTSATVKPSDVSDSDDSRDLGLRLDEVSWTVAR